MDVIITLFWWSWTDICEGIVVPIYRVEHQGIHPLQTVCRDPINIGLNK